MRRPFSGTVGLRAVTATKEDGTWNSSRSDAIWEIAGLKSALWLAEARASKRLESAPPRRVFSPVFQ
jgi:hypothetical protein